MASPSVARLERRFGAVRHDSEIVFAYDLLLQRLESARDEDMMSASERRVHLDEGNGDGVEIDLYGIRSGGTDDALTRTRTHRASGTEHEVKRRQFASGPGANDAANMLERALGLSAPASVVAEFAPRTLRCVKHRFDQEIVSRELAGIEHNGP